jgi:hypothetical protein
MCGRGVLVHCPGRLGAAATVPAAELPRCDGVLAKWALERGKAVHYFDGVMSHTFNCSCFSQDDSEPKSLSPPVKWQAWHSPPRSMRTNSDNSPIDGQSGGFEETGVPDRVRRLRIRDRVEGAVRKVREVDEDFVRPSNDVVLGRDGGPCRVRPSSATGLIRCLRKMRCSRPTNVRGLHHQRSQPQVTPFTSGKGRRLLQIMLLIIRSL